MAMKNCIEQTMSRPLRSRVNAAFVSVAGTVLISSLPGVHGTPSQPDEEKLLAQAPRPLHAALQQFEPRCHCVVTYEDRKWRSDEVQDLPGRTPGPETPKVPKGNPFMFSVSRDNISERTPDRLGASLQEILNAFEQTNGVGMFRVVSQGGTFHVLPKEGSVLDAVVSFESGSRTLSETIGSILQAASDAKGEKIRLGTAPTNLMKQTVSLAAHGERASEVLSRALSFSGRKLSWSLLYDFGYQAFYMNIHAVH
jgi:hypothetical protein